MISGDLGHAIATGRAGRRSHLNVATFGTNGLRDSVVIGGHDGGVEQGGLADPIHNMEDERPAAEEREGFTGEPRRSVTCRYDPRDLQFSLCPLPEFPVPNRFVRV